MLGYNVLFQDVDVVWHRNPLDLFQNSHTNNNQTNPNDNFDIIFQDDGARSFRFAPYSANSGFYYVRANDRTKYLFTSQILLGDMILQSNSHQDTMTALLSHHSTLHGLRVKTIDRDTNLLPCGFHYHRRKEYMKKMVEGTVEKPYIFHMSWTNNKEDKIKFFQQMGDWHLQDQCTPTFLQTAAAATSPLMTPGELVGSCCTAEPNFKCHYSDKPSIRPCKDSPKMEKKDKSFWP
jgi:hypothetical protein